MPEEIKQRGDYYPLYVKQTIDSFQINRSSLRVGMVCKILYNSMEREEKKSSIYLIISTYDGNIHTIDLDYVDPSKLKSLFNICINKRAEKIEFNKSTAFIFQFKIKGKSLFDIVVSYLGKKSYRVLKSQRAETITVCNLQMLVNSIPKKVETQKKEVEVKKKEKEEEDNDNKKNIKKSK